MELDKIIDFLKNYDGPQLKLMEVCGTHTSSIARSGIRGILSQKIKLISGPGCPVCVTPAAYVDRCIDYSLKENHALVTFGDMMKVPGASGTLSAAKGRGARVELMYSPFETIGKAERNVETIYVVAAVGFETTAPAYALLVKEAKEKNIKNIRLVTALKTIAPALAWICENEKAIDGFLCPGHVSVITGTAGYEALCEKYGRPFAIAGFEPEQILACVYDLAFGLSNGRRPEVHNLYKSAVKEGGNKKAQEVMAECYMEGDAMWRGIGTIENSGLYLSKRYAEYDGGSFGLNEDLGLPEGCRCGDVIVGRISPDECPMFGRGCSPENPVGPCMASSEGACGVWR
ncbi:MAG: hydrogenase formation protein HypD [Clostridiales bacterium]|nr:hydrogenase formation protein HypD [Clostridiales bacterium]